MPTPHRAERVSDELRRRLTELIQTELNDPRISFMSSITRIEMSPDLRYAKVFVSVMAEPAEQQASVAALRHAAGFLRRAVGAELRLRHTPELQFVLDHSIEEGDHVLRVIRDVERQEQQQREATRMAELQQPGLAPEAVGPAHEELRDSEQQYEV